MDEIIKKLEEMGVPSQVIEKVKSSLPSEGEDKMKEDCCPKCGAPMKSAEVSVEISKEKTGEKLGDLMKRFKNLY